MTRHLNDVLAGISVPARNCNLANPDKH